MTAYVPDYWQQGRLLHTNRTRQYSKYEWDRYDAEERRMVFRNFDALDEGRSRERIAVFETAEDAARAVRDHNAAERSRADISEGRA